jgi:hypothetical protein
MRQREASMQESMDDGGIPWAGPTHAHMHVFVLWSNGILAPVHQPPEWSEPILHGIQLWSGIGCESTGAPAPREENEQRVVQFQSLAHCTRSGRPDGTRRNCGCGSGWSCRASTRHVQFWLCETFNRYFASVQSRRPTPTQRGSRT